MNSKYIIGSIVAVIVVAGATYYVKFYAPISVTPTEPVSIQNIPLAQPVANDASASAVVTTPATTTKTTATTTKKVVQKVTPALISSVVLTNTITKTTTSVQTGNIMTIFTPTAKNIYAVLDLKNATPRTQLAYIRKYEGKYVDSKVSHPLKTGDKQFYFGWTTKAGQTIKTGNYSITFYVDGKKAQTVAYSVR